MTRGRGNASASAVPVAALNYFGIGEEQLIGAGSWSRVYAFQANLVLRILPDPPRHASLLRLQEFYRSLARDACTLLIPEFLEVGTIDEVCFVIERRIPGIDLAQRLEQDGSASEALLTRVLASLTNLEPLLVGPCEAGELLAGSRVRARGWRQFLLIRAARELEKGRDALQSAGCDVSVAWRVFNEGLEKLNDGARSLVHGDLHPGNIMVDTNDQIVGILDFGPMTLAGDPAFDRVSAQLNWHRGENLHRLCEHFSDTERTYLLFWAFRFADTHQRSSWLFQRAVAILLALTPSHPESFRQPQDFGP